MPILQFAGLSSLAALLSAGLSLPACALMPTKAGVEPTPIPAVSAPGQTAAVVPACTCGEDRSRESAVTSSSVSNGSAAVFGSLPDEPGAPVAARVPSMASGAGAAFAGQGERLGIKPFSGLGVAVKVGIGGIGFDLVTPLTYHLNLRGGASFFDYNTHINTDNIDIGGTLNVRRAEVQLDYYPFASRFHISPGLTMYNGNKLNATATVAGGQEFDLGDSTNYSMTGNPIHGSANLNFGNKVAPSLTIGYGNVFKHGGGHFSFQFEGGFEYTSAPKITLLLAGNACQDQAQTMCGPVDQTEVQSEQKEINDDISLLRFFPIFNIGLGYRFGRTGSR